MFLTQNKMDFCETTRLQSIPGGEFQAAIEKVAIDYPFFPLGFIKRASAEGLRRSFFDDIVKAGPDLEHMAFRWQDDASGEWVIAATHLKWDSKWFGKSIIRLDLVTPTAPPFDRPYSSLKGLLNDLVSELQSLGHDYVFMNVPVTNVGLVKGLGEAGFSLIETRMTYWLDNVSRFHTKKRSSVRIAQSVDVGHLGKIAAEIVNPYDRFHADEYFDRDTVYRLMQEWVNASVNKGYADVVLVPDDGKPPAALITALYHKDKWELLRSKACQIMFMAASADVGGWVWARRLLAETTFHLQGIGAEVIHLTTQAPNKIPIRAAESFGYRYGDTSLIFRRVIS